MPGGKYTASTENAGSNHGGVDDANINGNNPGFVYNKGYTKETTFGYCPQCKKANNSEAWCNLCDRKILVDKFDTWSTGDANLDHFIQQTQKAATNYKRGYLEYVPYNRLTDVKSLGGLGEFTAEAWLDSRQGEVFTATWLDGERVQKEVEENKIVVNYIKGRSEPLTVSLEIVVNSENIDSVFINQLKRYYQLREKDVYGITHNPETMNYYLVLRNKDLGRDPKYGYCSKCKKANHSPAWCGPCDRKTLVDKYNTWSTGNANLDQLVQYTQRTATGYTLPGYLEYVPYDRLINVKFVGTGLGEFKAAEWLDGAMNDIYTARWLDGERIAKRLHKNKKVKKRAAKRSHNDKRVKGRSEPFTVSLEMIIGSTNIDIVFIRELKRHYQLNRADIYGITQDPETMNYGLVLKNDDARRESYFGHCPQCKKKNLSRAWCDSCDQKALIDKFSTWSTGNKKLDLFIQETQKKATSYLRFKSQDGYLEYVPYDRFTDLKLLGQGGFGEVFTATWLDGYKTTKWSKEDNNYIKSHSEPFTVALKIIKNSARMEESFINELKLYHQFKQKSYGITRCPETGDYGLIMEYYPDGDLRNSLIHNKSWVHKLRQLKWIVVALRGIHQRDFIHRDIHSGNILINESETHLVDFGLTQPAEHTSNAGIYGVIPYMAPELFRGEQYSKASDIYAIGIIMSEIALGKSAFCDRDHDLHLQIEIIEGLRPEVPPETPKCYKDLMDRCLSKNPLDRPTVSELNDVFCKWYWDVDSGKNTPESNQFKVADEQWKPGKPELRHPGAIYTSRLINYMKTDTKGSTQTVPISCAITTSDLEIYGYRKSDN